MARNGRRLLARRRREHDRDVRRGRYGADFDPQAAADEALREGAAATKLEAPRSAAGDGERLRGIPAIGRGVTGEIRGTRPTVTAKLGRWRGR